MLRDNRVGRIELMLTAREIILSRRARKHMVSDDSPQCLENPRPKGGTSTLSGERRFSILA
jgi:hypothetical protein